jgi:hypothetical protein
LELPSELTALPRSNASTRWPFRRASGSRSNRSRPTPSDQAVPSADAANGLHRPSGASARSRLNATKGLGEDSTVAPPAMASEHSPARSAAAAKCIATREEEHAVSTVMDGPRRPST